MKVRVRLNGRKVGAIGIMHDIGTFEGEGGDIDIAIVDAQKKAYSDGWDHIMCAEWHNNDDGTKTPIVDVIDI